MADELGVAIRENARDLAQLSELPAVSNHMNCPRISLPTSICWARGEEDSAGSFKMIDREKRMLFAMLCGWTMIQVLPEQNSGVDQGVFQSTDGLETSFVLFPPFGAVLGYSYRKR
jgi:hypothetical protein